jgi:hypothetical protein
MLNPPFKFLFSMRFTIFSTGHAGNMTFGPACAIRAGKKSIGRSGVLGRKISSKAWSIGSHDLHRGNHISPQESL